ncbi:MAG: ISNCY family transposase [Endomicrobiales bacterium]
MSNRDIDRLKVLHFVIKKRLTWKQAAVQLGVTKRHIGRLLSSVKNEGNKGIIHRLCGKPSNHQLMPGVMDTSIQLIKTRYDDFGPTLANEKLLELHGITVSTSAVRTAMIEAKIWHSHSQAAKHRQWRPRRPCVGELIQLDGSDHDWFEGRGPRCALLVFIDDATSRILYAEFVTVENTLNLLSATKHYLLQHGRPLALYVDKDSVYKINHQQSIEEQLNDDDPSTQYARAMDELGIEIIFAHSPQAKGRVERSFNTHQDRLVKELRLAHISNIASANTFLMQTYIPHHNARFSVPPARTLNAHRPLLRSHILDEILSIKIQRTVGNDYTIRFHNLYLQLLAHQKVRLHPKAKIIVQTRLDSSMHLSFKDHYLNYTVLPHRPYKPYYAANKRLLKGYNKPCSPNTPPKTHPWRRYPVVSAKQLATLPL